jgi:transposase-like protein
MAKKQRTYTPEFRQQMVELVRVGRKYDELAAEFGCSSWSIRQWVKRADRDAFFDTKVVVHPLFDFQENGRGWIVIVEAQEELELAFVAVDRAPIEFQVIGVEILAMGFPGFTRASAGDPRRVMGG